MQDLRLSRVDKQLASAISVLLASCRDAELLKQQDLADDLWQCVHELKAIHAGIGPRGQTYKRPSARVRN